MRRKPLALYAADPLGFARDVLGFEPHEAQKRVLDASIRKGILCCTRGFGKTEITAVLAAWHFAVHRKALIVVVSETAEKAAELVERARAYLEQAGILTLPDRIKRNGFKGENGSRILPIPSRHGAVRGFPATMILVDEAALVPDKVWMALSGTRASTFKTCRVWMMSTPGACVGFFYTLYHSTDPSWTRICVPVTECQHIPQEFREEMEREMEREDYRREFLAEFVEKASLLFSDAVRFGIADEGELILDLSDEARARQPFLAPRPVGERVLLATDEWTDRNGYVLSADLGQSRDHSAFALLEYRLEPLGYKDPITLVPAYRAKYVLKALERLPLHTSYVDMATIFADYLKHRDLEGRTTVVLDAGGVGRAFLDQVRAMRLGAHIIPVQFTGGWQERQDGGILYVPKQEPMMRLESLMRQGLLKVAARLPLWRELQAELGRFERRRSATGRVQFTGKTPGGGTDDLVIALALGAWVAEKKLRTAGPADEDYARWRKANPLPRGASPRR